MKQKIIIITIILYFKINNDDDYSFFLSNHFYCLITTNCDFGFFTLLHLFNQLFMFFLIVIADIIVNKLILILV